MAPLVFHTLRLRSIPGNGHDWEPPIWNCKATEKGSKSRHNTLVYDIPTCACQFSRSNVDPGKQSLLKCQIPGRISYTRALYPIIAFFSHDLSDSPYTHPTLREMKCVTCLQPWLYVFIDSRLIYCAIWLLSMTSLPLHSDRETIHNNTTLAITTTFLWRPCCRTRFSGVLCQSRLSGDLKNLLPPSSNKLQGPHFQAKRTPTSKFNVVLDDQQSGRQLEKMVILWMFPDQGSVTYRRT